MAPITSYAQLVPWRNKEEWLEVYKKLYSNQPDDMDWAVNRISVWQARCLTSALLGVETTAALVRARIQDQNYVSNGLTNVNQLAEISLMYSMAIVRFVNLVCEIGKNPAHMVAIRNVAQRMGIPEWLVNIRHTATHKYSIPSLDMLRTGCSVSLQWLKLNYWEKEILNLDDFVSTRGPDSQLDTTDEIHNLMRDFQACQFDVLYGDKGKKIQSGKRAALKAVLSKLRVFLKNHPNLFVKILSESGFLVSKYVHLEAILKPGEKEFLENNSVQLPRALERFWAPVLNLFLLNDPLQCLLRCLLQRHTPEDALADRVAAAWVSHILNIISEKEYHIFFFKPTINWLELFEVALKQPTPFSPHVLKIISENVPVGEDMKQALMALVAIFLGNVSSTVIPKKVKTVYTAKDIEMKVYPDHLALEPSGLWKKDPGNATEWQKLPMGSVIRRDSAEGRPRDHLDKTVAKPVTEVSELVLVEMEEICAEPSESVQEESAHTAVAREPDLSNSLLFL